jgi:hypothetical protein
VAAHNLETHHRTPRHLLRLHREAQGVAHRIGCVEAWLEWEEAAVRYGVPVEIGAGDLAELVESSAVVIPADDHRDGHSAAGDFARWGRLGGLRTLQLYGTSWFSALALRRWGRITAEDLDAMRVVR